jgi:hypothetical protein
MQSIPFADKVVERLPPVETLDKGPSASEVPMIENGEDDLLRGDGRARSQTRFKSLV